MSLRPRMGHYRWQHQWLRALRWYERASGAWRAASIDHVEDFVLATWTNVWHVADYLSRDPEARAVITNLRQSWKANDLATGIPALELIKDLANVTKHAQLTRKWEHDGLHVGGLGHAGWVDSEGRENPETVWLYVRWEGTPGPGVPALLPAYDALHAWRSRFREWRLPWDSLQPGVEWPSFAEPPNQKPRR